MKRRPVRPYYRSLSIGGRIRRALHFAAGGGEGSYCRWPWCRSCNFWRLENARHPHWPDPPPKSKRPAFPKDEASR